MQIKTSFAVPRPLGKCRFNRKKREEGRRKAERDEKPETRVVSVGGRKQYQFSGSKNSERIIDRNREVKERPSPSSSSTARLAQHAPRLADQAKVDSQGPGCRVSMSLAWRAWRQNPSLGQVRSSFLTPRIRTLARNNPRVFVKSVRS